LATRIIAWYAANSGNSVVSMPLTSIQGKHGRIGHLSVTLTIHVLRLGYGRFKSMLAANAVYAAPRLYLILVNRVDLFPGEKDWLLFKVETVDPYLGRDVTGSR
jgi:hypothetical protein